jgi:hypothetical protein
MTGLRTRLMSGECGVRWTPPEAAVVKESGDQHFLLTETGRPVAWQVEERWIGFAFDPAHDDALRQDIADSTRHLFQGTASDEDLTSTPIEYRRIELRGGPALRVIRRFALAPGKEIVVGHLIVPTATGHLDIRVLAREMGTTGLRETLLVIAEKLQDVPQPERCARFDDPAHDAKFPNHPLSLVRRALDQRIEAIEVLAPAPPLAVGEIEIAPHRCVIVPPPRFVLLPPHPTLKPRIFMRVGLEGWHRNLEVWRVEHPAFRRRDPRGELCHFARTTIARWADEGVGNIDTDVAPIEDFQGRPQVEQSGTGELAAHRSDRRAHRTAPQAVVAHLVMRAHVRMHR